MPGWIEITLRSTSVIIFLFILTKWLGKKQISQLTFFEYITGITIGSIAAEASFDETLNLYHGLVAMFIWALIPFLVGVTAMKSKRARNFLEGKATILIKDGKVLEDNLKKEKYTIDELLEQLRKSNIFSIEDVEYALLEPGGDVTVLLKKENQPVTAKDLNLDVAPIKQPETVIMDGVILDEPLATRGYNRNWLQNEVDKQGVAIENIFIGQLNEYGELFVDLYDDKISVQPSVERPLLLATLKKSQADLELYSLSTENKEAIQLYKKNAKKLISLINKVEKYLT
ncbi:hypothetical protein CIB95_07755 [Lottiidibacillus patelloidae]|uniref:DUF421 domain-containing protein n=1 Tax=Lottiidibacillus patelloidae TaxID=2670334 RepID=A0A263BVJ1_9BACI|nr:DUF421 domain-containing protein [Lottiidibacillus patelloidae]OZM57347.1 hypothetical protein CIB95_07755 [Lottiidibacillus patelloidae]